MAAAGTLSVQDVSRSGLSPSFSSAAADGHYVPNNGRVFLYVRNTGSQSTMTIQTPGSVGGNAVADSTATCTATTGDQVFGPFPPDIYNDALGRIFISFSSTTGVTVAAIRIP